MLPIRLKVQNFLPYRAPDTLLFEGIHLACLTGNNGAGKSSLLDAITWALWGKSRATSRRDDELIHIGQIDMSVQLDFEQEGVTYRVYRRRARSKRSQGSLDLFVIQPDGELLTINEPSMRGTQAKIDGILRLDYETFVHSAFLQQGKADAFTTQKPAERKRILSEILGLDDWNVYEERVKEQLKNIQVAVKTRQLQLQDIEKELQKEPQFQQALRDAQTDFDAAEQAEKDAQAALDQVAYAPAALIQAREKKAEQERRQRGHEAELQSVNDDIERHSNRKGQYEAIIALSEEIQSGYAALQSARQAQSELADKLRQISSLDSEYNALEKQLDAARAKLESERGSYQAVISELQSSIQADTQDKLDEVQAQIVELEQVQTESERAAERVGELREALSGIRSQQKTLEDEGKELNERLEKLEHTDEAACPLCGQPLNETHRAEIIAQITAQRDDKREQYRRNNQHIHDTEAEIIQLEAQIKQMKKDLKRLPKLQGEEGALVDQLGKAANAQSRLETEQANLAAVERILAEDDYAHEVREQMAALRQQRAGIGYDKEKDAQAQQELDQYKDFEQQQMQLKVAQESLPGIEDSITHAVKRREGLEARIQEEAEAIEKTEDEIKGLEVLVNEHRQREQEVKKQRTRLHAAQENLITAQQQLNALAAQRVRKQTIEDDLQRDQHKEGLYNELRVAFGKDGVPAMMIETAIPELEAEANQLLARMTDGKMHLRLTTQREKVSGGTMETLDIEIADELGTRNYDLYSGGEAFRINFAIRVALSKLLARRAGAHLRTLFIDEGFGTQDEDGRNKLVEAITTVQDEFDLVLVITHIDDLRDSFPVHIIVEKTPAGSVFTLR